MRDWDGKEEIVGEEQKYFIVNRYYLGERGSEQGSTREEVQELLKETDVGDDLIVIKGILLEPVLQLLDEE